MPCCSRLAARSHSPGRRATPAAVSADSHQGRVRIARRPGADSTKASARQQPAPTSPSSRPRHRRSSRVLARRYTRARLLRSMLAELSPKTPGLPSLARPFSRRLGLRQRRTRPPQSCPGACPAPKSTINWRQSARSGTVRLWLRLQRRCFVLDSPQRSAPQKSTNRGQHVHCFAMHCGH